MIHIPRTQDVELKHFAACLGAGGGKKGFAQARFEIPGMRGRFRYIGGIDVDAAALTDADEIIAPGGARSTCMDLFDLEQYVAFHGRQPAEGWREATPADVRAAAHGEVPDVVFVSAPCKGFSGLMSESRSKTAKYQALNRLTLRTMWLMLEAWQDDPVPFYLFENVPRIANRGRWLLDQITALLHQYGYAVAETTHDCGELGGLHQSRRRFLLVARHMAKVPAFLYEPPKRPLRPVGELLERMPLPGDPAAGPMHRVPSLSWKTWVRLAFVEAGKDWRSLNRLAVENGYLRDYLIVPDYHDGYLGVRSWDDPTGAVQGASLPSNGAFSVADPRAAAGVAQYQQYGVLRWGDASGAVIGVKSPGQGTFSVCDPRIDGVRHNNAFRIIRADDTARAVTGGLGSVGGCVADLRCANWHPGASSAKYRVCPMDAAAGTVTGAQQIASGALAVADPRPGLRRESGDAYLTAGHYGVVRWEDPSGAVSAAACHDNGRWSLADPRSALPTLPAAADRLVAVIRALDDTWHRPFTTLELAALQGLYDPEEDGAEPWAMTGTSDQAWRERIGNAVPAPAARAIAEEIGRTILLARAGETFQLSATPVWVRPVAVAVSVAQGERQ